MKYLDDIDDAYSGLDMLDAGYTTHQKIQNLLHNLQFSPSDNYLISHCRDTFTTFEECITYLTKEAVRHDDVAGRLGKRHAKQSHKTVSVNNATTDGEPNRFQFHTC